MLIGLLDDDKDFTKDVAVWTRGISKSSRPRLSRCKNRRNAFNFLRNLAKENAPVMLLLDMDLNGNKTAGMEILGYVRQSKNKKIRRMPVVIYSNSKSGPDVEQSYLASANSFVWKGFGADQKERFLALVAHWQKLASLPGSRRRNS